MDSILEHYLPGDGLAPLPPPPDDRFRAVEDLLLLVDAALARLGWLEVCMIALPWSVWVPWKLKTTGEPPRRVTLPRDPEFLENDRVIDAVWSDIPVRDGKLRSGAGCVKGYWVRHEELGCDGGIFDARIRYAAY